MSSLGWLWAIPVFGLLIFIHELGHFAVAKWNDIKVHEFALGFGPVVAGFGKGETRYNLRLIPLGGFVRMAGMEEGEMDDPRGFDRKPIWARAAVIFAGPLMNLILASIFFSVLQYNAGVAAPDPVLGSIIAECPAAVNGQTVAQPCPAAAAGMQAGDRVLAINGKSVSSWSDILNTVTASKGQSLTFQIERASQRLEVPVQAIEQGGRFIVGITPSTRRESFLISLAKGPGYTWDFSKAWLGGMFDMVTGRSQVELSGPVGITREIATQAAAGWANLVWLTAIISINLGLFNLLPIPALDGSRLVFMLVELIRGRRVDPRRESMVHFVGLMLMLGLIVVVTYGDIFGR